MDYIAYQARINHNYQLAREVKAGRITAYESVARSATWQHDASGNQHISSHWFAMNYHDIFGAIWIGVLPTMERNGPDAYELRPDGSRIGHEIKTRLIDRSVIWRTPRGAMYIGDPHDQDRRACLTSYIAGKYDLGGAGHRASKAIDTTLLVIDREAPQGPNASGLTNREAPFTAWRMSGDAAGRRLATGAASREIKLNAFMKDGHELVGGPVPLVGWAAVRDELLATVPVVRSTRKPPSGGE